MNQFGGFGGGYSNPFGGFGGGFGGTMSGVPISDSLALVAM